MTTEAEINDQITVDYNRFWHSPYEGKIPEGMMSKFREAIMFHNARSLPGNPTVLRGVLQKKEYDLNFLEVGIIINTIFPISFNAIFFSPEEAMDAVIEYKEIEIEYNERVEKKGKQIEAKRSRLLSLSGITNKTIPLNSIPRKN